MVERIREIAAGIFDDEDYEAGCSVSEIDEVINAGGKKSGYFYVIKNGGIIKGVVYSSDHRVRVITESFSGSSCKIEYEIDASGMRNGDEIDGRFSIINDCGEWFVPYHISVIYVRSELAENIKSMESFAELAKEDWNLALKLCESESFMTLPFMQDTGYSAVYQSLRKTVGRNNFLEEFLIGCKAKQPVMVSVTGNQNYVRQEMRSSDYLYIKRDTWGHVNLKISTDSDFIVLMKKEVSEADFEDDICEIEYKVDEGRLHNGRNFGRVIVEGIRQRIVININIYAKASEKNKKDIKLKNCFARAAKYYIEYYTRPNERSRCLELIRDELYEMIPLDEKNLKLILAVAWVSIKKGDLEDAERILNRLKSSIDIPGTDVTPEYCIYHYLCYLAGIGNENLEVLVKLMTLCYSETKDGIVFHNLLMINPEWQSDPVKKLGIIRHAFENGCTAPWLYTEACSIYITNPELLESIENFELNCLLFGAREEFLTFELSEKVASFAFGRAETHRLYLRILMYLYNTHKSMSVLKGICNILLKKDMRQSECFEWYARAVEADIKITKLYEYYIYTMPENYDKPVYRAVLLYFSYINTLDVPSKIKIYRNVLKHYPTDEQIRMCYAGQIENFTLEQLTKAYVDDGMAELYNKVIKEDIIDRRIASVLPKMLYAAGFYCANKKIRKIAVCYREFNYEQMIIPKNGVAHTVLFSENYIAVGIDVEGRRYSGLDIKVVPVFEKKDFIAACRDLNPNQDIIRMRDGLDLFEQGISSGSEHHKILDLLQDNNIRDTYKAGIVSGLTNFYKDCADAAPEALLNVKKELVSFENRQDFIEILAKNDKLQRAFEFMQAYGWDDVSDKSLLEVASRMIVDVRFSRDWLVLDMAHSCFKRGCFNQRVLEYLLKNYNGDSYTMSSILKAAVSSNCRKFDFVERLLSQLIFVGNHKPLDEVFRIYFDENLKDETIVQAYLAIKNRAYLIEDKKVPMLVHTVTEQFVLAGRKLADVSQLALCKYYSELDLLTDEQRRICSRLINAYCRDGIVFAFFKKLGKFIRLPDGLNDKAIIEYRAKKDSVVKIKTMLLPDESCWNEELIPHMFEGVFVKTVTLLRGEILDYEIYDGDEKQAVIGSESLNEGSAGILGCGRGVMINRLLEAKENKDLGGLMLNSQSYIVLNEVADSVFKLLD